MPPGEERRRQASRSCSRSVSAPPAPEAGAGEAREAPRPLPSLPLGPFERTHRRSAEAASARPPARPPRPPRAAQARGLPPSAAETVEGPSGPSPPQAARSPRRAAGRAPTAPTFQVPSPTRGILAPLLSTRQPAIALRSADPGPRTATTRRRRAPLNIPSARQRGPGRLAAGHAKAASDWLVRLRTVRAPPRRFRWVLAGRDFLPLRGFGPLPTWRKRPSQSLAPLEVRQL